MRIYLPLSPADIDDLERSRGLFRLVVRAGRVAWGVSSSARADRPGEDLEDLEYDAMQDAVFAAFENAGAPVTGTARAAVVAGDVPDAAIVDDAERGGAFGVRLIADADMRIASIHVTEHGADAVRADDTDPALLWFDAAECADALAYLRRAPGT